MVAFIDDKCIDEIKEKYNNSKYKKTKFIPINVEWMRQNIYAWKQIERSKAIMQSQQYINLVQSLINNSNPANICSEYNAINHSKIDFICYAINCNYISTDNIVYWSDFGYFGLISDILVQFYIIILMNIRFFHLIKIKFLLIIYHFF